MPSQHSKTKVVIFDLDGTLNDVELMRNALWPIAAEQEGFPGFSKEEFLCTLGKRSEDVLLALRLILAPDLPEEQGVLIAQRVRARRNVLLSDHLSAAATPLRFGVQSLLNTTAALGIPQGINTSSTSKELAQTLSALKMPTQFVFHVTSEDIPEGQGKPAPYSYELARKRAEATLGIPISPDECLAIEDSSNGANSALAAGMRLAYLPTLEPVNATLENNSLPLAGLQELRDWLLVHTVSG